MTVEYEPFATSRPADPYPIYAELRSHDPVHFAPESETYCVSRYDDVVSVLKRPELFSSSAMRDVLTRMDVPVLTPRYVFFLLQFLWRTKISPFAVQRVGNLTTIDPPRHDEMRSIVNRGFTPRQIASWESRAREVVAGQLRRLDETGRFDVVEDLAVPLPVTIISEMLGIEDERRADFKRWSDGVVAVASGGAKQNPFESGVLDNFAELFCYMKQAVRERRERPRDDLISLLVDPAQDGVLSELEMVQFIVLLLVAGNETTTNLIGNAVNALLDHPAQLERVAANPERVPDLIEETLRFDSPIQLLFRKATEETEVGGTKIPKDGVVTLMLGAANRDPSRFDRADEFDVDRDARGHLAFGLGVHFCLGSSLARLEARVALEAITPELPRLKSVGARDELIDSFLVRGRRHLQLAAGSAISRE